jgi:sodium transport system permease protein
MRYEIWTVVRKELARVFTDRRLVISAFIMPALTIAILYGVMGVMITRMFEDREAHQTLIAVVDAPETFVGFAEASPQADVVFEWESEAALSGLKGRLFTGDLDAIVAFEKSFDTQLAQFQQNSKPEIRIFYNTAEDYSVDARARLISGVLKSYETGILTDRFGDISYLSAFETADEVVADPKKVSGKGIGSFLPLLLSIFLFAGGMGIGLDSIAGEKERGTMATMLVTPVRRESIVFGKLISLAVVAFLSSVSTLVGIVASAPFASFLFGGVGGAAGGLGAGFVITPGYILSLLFICIILTMIYVALISLISVYARNVKEAGTYITPVYMMVMLLGVLTTFSTGQPDFWVFGVPIYGNVQLMKMSLSYEMTWQMMALNTGVSLVFLAVLVAVIRKMFNSERIMFNA